PPSTPAVVRRPSTGGFKIWSAMACLFSTPGSTARALRFAQRIFLGPRIVVEIELTIPWNVLCGCGPLEPPYYIAPVQTFLRITRRPFPDQSVVQVIGFPLWYALLHELARGTARRVLFDPIDQMLQLDECQRFWPSADWAHRPPAGFRPS